MLGVKGYVEIMVQCSEHTRANAYICRAHALLQTVSTAALFVESVAMSLYAMVGPQERYE